MGKSLFDRISEDNIRKYGTEYEKVLRIIINQYRSSNSPFHTIFRKMQERSVSMGVAGDINEDALERINREFKPRSERG